MSPHEEDIPQQSAARSKEVDEGTAGNRWICRDLKVRRLSIKGSKWKTIGQGKRQR